VQPNAVQAAGVFDAPMVTKQLLYLGVLETVLKTTQNKTH
jgi:myosin heavy subunit